MDKTIFRVFILRRYFVLVPDILHFSIFWCFCSYVSLWKRHGLPQLWVPCAATASGYIIIQVWARCVPCAESRVFCAVWNAILSEKKQAAGPNCLGATLSSRTRARAPAGVSFSCWFVCLFFFFLFSHLFLIFWCFCSNIISYVYYIYMHLIGTARLSPPFPVQGHV